MIEIYGIPKELHNCYGCVHAMKLLEERGIEYTFYPVIVPANTDLGFDYDRARIDEMAKRLNKRGRAFTYPQIFKDGVLVGSYKNLRELLGDDDV